MLNYEAIVQPEEFGITKVFEETEYVIPIYQRNYAWKKDEIEQLLTDICDSTGRYCLGSLIVNRLQANTYEVIDGQQRLTTLYLLLSFLNDDSIKEKSLRFEAREKSNKTLRKIVSLECQTDKLAEGDWYSEEIKEGYNVIVSFFTTQDDGVKEKFISKLDNIFIIRTQVPEKIDLNHYFEIMNTRGEQLELHEIVKAKIMGAIKSGQDKKIAAVIWDACAQMEKYVQMNFDKVRREKIFGDEWTRFEHLAFDHLRECFKDAEVLNEDTFTLRSKLESPEHTEKADHSDADEENERFESIISFPNFLLQVNEAMGVSDLDDPDAGLDDKRFMSLLKRHWDSGEAAALDFIFYLLKYRVLFDKYIIKREYKGEYRQEGRWSLRKLEMYEDVKRRSRKPLYKGTYNAGDNDSHITGNVRMLQSCLRVTYTSPKTMHWIAKLLAELDCDENTDVTSFLEEYCCDKVEQAEYKEKQGFSIERIVFTYLDYVLYRENRKEFEDFQFQFRNSIEHFYPQHPTNKKEWDTEDLKEALNSFGNLALITVSANSKFSNMLPASKVESYGEIIGQSPKLMRMRKLMQENNGIWDEKLTKKHNDEMIAILAKEIKTHVDK